MAKHHKDGPSENSKTPRQMRNTAISQYHNILNNRQRILVRIESIEKWEIRPL